jgi:hypothetical protein
MHTGNHASAVKRLVRGVPFTDGLLTLDQAAQDSAGVFLIGELERLDQTLHMPLAAVTWSRDIDLREDVSIADETSSYTNSSFANAPGVPGSGKSWIGKNSNATPGMDLDIGKTALPLNIWGQELGWTLPELASAERVGRPIDTQKYEGMQLKYNMDVDEQVYMGDTGLSLTGMLNHTLMTETANAVTGTWATATATQIVADVNELLNKVWANSGYAVMPDTLLLAPKEYGLLVTTLVSSAGNISILTYLKQNSLTNSVLGKPLNVFPCKWLTGTSNSGKGPTSTNAMYAYSKNKQHIRIALVPLQRTPLEFRGIRQLITYYGRIGSVELVYPETCGRRANLS